MASDEGRPGVEGPVALHIMFSRQPVRSHHSSDPNCRAWSMRNQSEEERQSNDAGKSEGCIVLMKPGNSGGGKAAERWSSIREAHSGLSAGTIVTTDLIDRTTQPLLNRDSCRGEPDALTAHVRFWEGAKLNRPSPSFMLNSEERARSTHPELPIGRLLKSKSPGGNRLILGVRASRLTCRDE